MRPAVPRVTLRVLQLWHPCSQYSKNGEGANQCLLLLKGKFIQSNNWTFPFGNWDTIIRCLLLPSLNILNIHFLCAANLFEELLAAANKQCRHRGTQVYTLQSTDYMITRAPGCSQDIKWSGDHNISWFLPELLSASSYLHCRDGSHVLSPSLLSNLVTRTDQSTFTVSKMRRG